MCRYDQDDLLRLKLTIRMDRNGDLSDAKADMVEGAYS